MASIRSVPVLAPTASPESVAATVFRPIQALIAWPSLIFLLALTAMLFRPPDLHFYGLDRIAFALLVAVVLLRALVMRQSLRLAGPVTWPMLALLLLALFDLLSSPAQIQDWSVFAAKWAVPFVLYHLAQLVFADTNSLKHLEIYLLIVLAYLCLTAIFFLSGADYLIFPQYILDENLGIHADRARGPFLQAVANGVALNILGLLALDAYRRNKIRNFSALLFAVALPLAVLATKTRSVWFAFTASILGLLLFSSNMRIRRACAYVVGAGLLVTFLVLTLAEKNTSLASRLEDRSPVEFRMSMYRAGWNMFLEKPWFGWPTSNIQPELSKRVEGFHQEQFFFHNSYLEVAVNYGLTGLALYVSVLVSLFTTGRIKHPNFLPEGQFLDEKFRSLWPVLVGVYVLNASFVVMNYQFVNALLFTLAGILGAQNRRAAALTKVF